MTGRKATQDLKENHSQAPNIVTPRFDILCARLKARVQFLLVLHQELKQFWRLHRHHLLAGKQGVGHAVPVLEQVCTIVVLDHHVEDQYSGLIGACAIVLVGSGALAGIVLNSAVNVRPHDIDVL